MEKSLNLILVLLLLIGCGRDADEIDQSCQDDGPNTVNIRILNLSAFEIIDFNYDNIQTFNSILPGEFTPYMQLETANNVPWSLEMVINGHSIMQRLIDGIGLVELDEACYTFHFFAVETEEGEFIISGKAYLNSDLNGFDPINQYCVELEKSACNPEPNKANIRIRNSTAFDFCNVDIKINNQENAIFGNLASGESTCYMSFESLKRYPLECKFNLGDEEYVIESPNYHEGFEDLSAGFYTYHIYIRRPGHKKGGIVLSTD